MGSSRHRDRSRDRDRGDRDRDRDRDRKSRHKRKHKRKSRDRHRHRDRDRDRGRDRDRRDRDRNRSKEKSREKTPPEPDAEKLIADALATIAATRDFASLMAPREPEYNPEQANGNQDDDGTRKRKKRSRWASDEHDKIFIPGMPTILPSGLDKNQETAYLLQIQIEEVGRKLRSRDLGIPANPKERSPSPEPIYSSDGKRLNMRESRTRKKLEEERHALVLRMKQINPDFKPPMDYCQPSVVRVSDKVMIPQEDHPEVNFVGLLIGPRGNTLKAMVNETGAKIIIRGRGSVKEGKVGRRDGQPLPGEDEPLHAYITATDPECVKKAVERIKEVIRQGVEVPDFQNDLRRMQLMELAQLNGTLRANEGMRCNNCGEIDHKSWSCPNKPNVTNNIVCSNCGGAGHIARDCLQKRPDPGEPPVQGDKAKFDEEYMSLMAELGEGPPPEAPKAETTTASTVHKTSFNLFEAQTTPRALMPPPVPTPTIPCMNEMTPPPMPTPTIPCMNEMPPPPWGVAQSMAWQPVPSAIIPPPAASSAPQMMPWMGAYNQPPPPGATTTDGNMTAEMMTAWQTAALALQAAAFASWPPGIDVNSWLTTPPPPPPS